MRSFNVLSDRVLLELIAEGTIPLIEKEIERYKNGDETLYGTVLSIGLICDTYHEALQTGNSVKCAEGALPCTDKGEE